MSELQAYLAELKEKYGDRVNITCHDPDDIMPDVPDPLRELYSLCDSIELPFGEIYRPDDEEAQRYFKDKGWYCFGFDDYFSYWLCSFEPDSDMLSFTSWDHDSDTDIEAVWADIIDFLRAMEEEAAELGNI